MKKIQVHIWAHRLEQAPTTVQEALEGLRRLLRKDPIARAEFFQVAREGWSFERFSREDKVALVLWAALKQALEKTRAHLGEKKKSTLQVRLDPYLPLQPRVSSFSWTSPEGRVYEVFPWDLTKHVYPGSTFVHPQYGKGKVLEVKGQVVLVRFREGRKELALKAVERMTRNPYATRPDPRVADAKGWLERFLASAEEVRGMSRLEREEELDASPHFSEGIVSPETVSLLERVGYRVDPHRLEELASLLDSLPTREEKFKESVLGITILRTRDGRTVGFRKPGLWETKVAPDAGQESFAALVEAQGAHAILGERLQEEGWSVSEVRGHLSKLARALSPADARRLFGLLQEIAALRRLKVELHRAGYAPVRAVAYRDSSGEVVYTAPVYGQ